MLNGYIAGNSLQGRRESNEDAHFTLKSKNGFTTWGVFDGHGSKLISNKLKELVPRYFEANLSDHKLSNQSRAKKLIKYIFDAIQDDLIKHYPKASKVSGSTANICILFVDPNDHKNKLITINTGDSRSVKCDIHGKSRKLTEDHKPYIPSELKRINKLGGKIEFDGSDWRILGLSLSRAFGDCDSKPFISHEPDINYYTLTSKDKCIITACDGLWDVLTDEEATGIIHMTDNIYNSANILSQMAYDKGSYDNITVLIKYL